jgi:iron complex outermembrane receptor protein
MFALTSSRVFKKKLLACALQAALPVLAGSALLAPGAAFAQTVDPTKTTELAEIVVTSSADASAEGLSKPYAGGQVARGGRAGILGTQDNMDTPFSITSYTSEFIQNQQARSVADVLQNDPTVRIARGFGNFQESFFIRGFIVGSDDIAYNGLYGLLPRQYTSAELFERVEVLRGASAFLNGASPTGGIGGSINLLPKRAGNEPLSQLSFGTASGSQFYTATDLSRRFGPDKSTGIRINAAHREGGSGISNDDVKLDLLTIGLDWRSRNMRLSGDFGYQSHKLSNARPNVSFTDATGTPFISTIPTAPDSKTNYAPGWSHSNERDLFGSARGEYDINSNLTVWAAAGARRSKEDNLLGGPTVTNERTGDATMTRFDNQREDSVRTAELGIRAKFNTGNIKHSLVTALSHLESKENNAYYIGTITSPTNIYSPRPLALPALDPASSFIGSNLANPDLVREKKLTSLAIGDTLSFADDKVLLTLGLRHQRIEFTQYPFNQFFFGAASPASAINYNKSKTSPVAGLVFKLRNDLSIYGNYIEGLSQGESVTDTTRANFGSSLPPYVSKQKEVGLKYDGGRIGSSLAFFSTSKPGMVVQNNFVTDNGKDEHQGIEFSAFGEAMRGLKILGGVTIIDAKQKRTGNAATEGKDVIGVPKRQANIGVEWSVPGLQGLSADARIVSTGASYADAANTLRVPGWTRLDLGARYLTEVNGRLVTIRARVDNVADRNYWSSVGGYPGSGYLVLGNPRTFSLTASIDF